MFKKGFISIIVVTLFMSVITVTASAQARIKVFIDGSLLSLSVSPVVEKGTTLVPMRSIFEALGVSVKWDSKTQTVTGEQAGKKIKLTIGQSVAYVNDKSVALVVPAKVINGSTLVPLRFVAESLGSKVEWRADVNSVLISSGSYVYPKDFATDVIDLYVVDGSGQYSGYNLLRGYPDDDKYRIYFKGDSRLYSVVTEDTRNINLNQKITWKYGGKTYISTKKELHSFFVDTAKFKNYLGDYDYTFTEQWYSDTFGDVYMEWAEGFGYENEASRWVDKYFNQTNPSSGSTVTLTPGASFVPQDNSIKEPTIEEVLEGINQTIQSQLSPEEKEFRETWISSEELRDTYSISASRSIDSIDFYKSSEHIYKIENVPAKLDANKIMSGNGIQYQYISSGYNGKLYFNRADLKEQKIIE